MPNAASHLTSHSCCRQINANEKGCSQNPQSSVTGAGNGLMLPGTMKDTDVGSLVMG